MTTNNRENIRVVVRFRPLNERELNSKPNEDFDLKIDTINNTINISQTQFTFDNVFDHHTTQEELFDKVARNAVDCITDGYNVTIFAYGNTSSGKSYTMFGHENKQPELQGIIPRACNRLFHIINDNTNVVEANVKCSFLEIYREHIRDLLGHGIKSDNYIPSLRIRQHQKKGVYVQGLIEKYVYCPEEIIETIKDGALQRSVGSTSLNSVSSRSHAVLTLTITQIMADGTEITSKMHLVDLAGSENVGKSEAVGTTLLEAQQINKSLSSLGNVIYALTEKGRDHIPYRDSRLTYILKDSLGGNAKTILIATASPHHSSYSETVNTLKFAKRAKDIKNVPTVNRNESNANLLKMVESLKKQLEDLQRKYDDNQAIVENVEKVDTTDSKQIALLKTKCERLEKHIEDLKDIQNKSNQRISEYRSIFEKQRDLAQETAKNLYEERVKTCQLSGELEQYKMFYESLKESIDSPELLEMIVKNTIIKHHRRLSINTSINVPCVEIDSPD